MSAETRIVQNSFGSFKRRFKADINRINAETAQVQAAIQKQLCPVSDEPHKHLVDTIAVEQRGESGFAVVEGDAEHPYWIYLEYGTENMDPRPHIRPAHQAALKHRRERLAELANK